MSNTPESRAAYAIRKELDGPQEILDIGRECAETSCHLIDFLPIKCPHCTERFCDDHYTPEKHECKKWNPLEADRRALECPLCSTLISVPLGEDPNVRMGQHVDNDCVVVTGKAAKKSSTPICALRRCDKRLWQPIECEKCHQQFCASHRYPASHSCPSSLTPASTASSSAQANPFANFSSQTSVKSAAAMAAFKRSLASAKTPSSPASPSAQPRAPPVSASASGSSSGSGSGSKTNPFSSKDRRANAERKSQLRAMQERQRKGLLSPAEEDRLKALQENIKDGKDDCVVM